MAVRDVEMRYMKCAFVLAMILSHGACAEQPQYSIGLTIGEGVPVCDALFSSVRSAPSEIIGSCDVFTSSDQNSQASIFIDWKILRDNLGPEFLVPEWRNLDISKQEDLELALFTLGAAFARRMEWPEIQKGALWTYSLSDAEIREYINIYTRNGTLPKDILLNPSELEIKPGQKFYEASYFLDGTDHNIFLIQDSTAPTGYTCAREYLDVYSTLILFGNGPRPTNNGAEAHRADDVVLFHNEMYGIRFSQARSARQSNSVSISRYSTEGDYNEFGTSSICHIDIQVARE
jgi:hypothetical protein